MYQFKKYLFDEYGGFGDKRVKDITKDCPFKIDDQSKDDKPEHFCGIFISVVEGTIFELHLTNNAPFNSKLKKMIESKGGEVCHGDYNSIRVKLNSKDHDFVLKLSDEIKGLVAPGKRYSNPNWKWSCPRTANSLKHFSKVLKNYKGKEITQRRFL